jgi:hypothetical protein
MMIHLQINHKNINIDQEVYPSNSVYHLFEHESKEYLWEHTGELVNPEQPVWDAQNKHGNHWSWIEKKSIPGGDEKKPTTSDWITFVISFILWIILLGTGFIPFIAQYYAIAIENILSLVNKAFVWILGPEDPFLYMIKEIVIQISRFIGNFVSILSIICIVWYFTALWIYTPYLSRYGECQANYMRRFIGGAIAVAFVFFYYSYDVGRVFLQSLRSLDKMVIIGPLMRIISKGGTWLSNKLRRPYGVPVWGPIIQSYFTALEQVVMPALMTVSGPIQLAVDDTAQFIKDASSGDAGPVNVFIDKIKLEGVVKSAEYQYKTEQQKAEELYNRSQKLTSRAMQWFLINLAGIFGGGVNILRKVCSSKHINELQSKLQALRTDRKMDENTRKALIKKTEYQIAIEKKRPKLDEACIINTIETGTLAGHLTIFSGIIVVIIFMFFKPPNIR